MLAARVDVEGILLSGAITASPMRFRFLQQDMFFLLTVCVCDEVAGGNEEEKRRRRRTLN